MFNEDTALIEAQRLVGIPFLKHGRTAEGADCWGIMGLWYQAFGIALPDPLSHEPAEVFAHPVSACFEGVEQCRTGDVARFMGGDDGRHIGIIVGKRVLHTTHRTGCILHAISRVTILPPFYRYKAGAA